MAATDFTGAHTGAEVDDAVGVAKGAGTGLLAKTGTGAGARRSIAAGSAKLTVSNGDGVAGNPSVDFGSVASTDLSDGSTLQAKPSEGAFVDGDKTKLDGAVLADGSGNDITGDLVFTEKADHSSTPGAGKGYLWTKNTAPSTLIFTDDSGADTTLGSGGGSSDHGALTGLADDDHTQYVLASGSRAMTGKLTVTQGTANTAALASTGYSLTGSDATPMVDLAGTWNTTGTPTAIKLNVTDTASNASSLLMDLQVGGVSQEKTDKLGNKTLAGTTLSFGDSATIKVPTNFKTIILAGSANYMVLKDKYLNISGDGCFGWSTGSGSALTTNDLAIWRDDANVLAQRNGTTAQEFRLYGTWTDASNYERLSFKANAGADFEIKPENAGTGTLRGLKLATSGGKLGFFGATAAVKPTITGSRGANAALASLLTELATLGLITDSTT